MDMILYKSKTLSFFVLISALFSLIGEPVLANKGGEASLGLLYGLTVPDSQNTNPIHLYGVKGSAHLLPAMSVGGYYLVPGQVEGSGGRLFKYSLHGVEVAYRKTGNKGSTFLGMRLGLSKLRIQDGAQDTILSPYHYGIVTGHDFQVLSWASIGFEGSFLQLENSATDEDGTEYEEDRFNIISFLVSLQFHF